ncbi:MAG: plasmid pRiA4b ORF-3 family protein [Desulfobacterales bacterium]
MPKVPKKTYQLKIGLKGAKPPIWRRFLVDSTMVLAEFHDVLQIVMGWSDSHLHQFTADGTAYGTPDPEFDLEGVRDERKVKLAQLLRHEKDAMIYEYDFGDGWTHTITLEKILPLDLKSGLPVCLKAKGACPPEDVGGLWGYYELLEALKDPKHPEHEESKEWIGEDFDPDAYDLEEVNALLYEYRR